MYKKLTLKELQDLQKADPKKYENDEIFQHEYHIREIATYLFEGFNKSKSTSDVHDHHPFELSKFDFDFSFTISTKHMVENKNGELEFIIKDTSHHESLLYIRPVNVSAGIYKIQTYSSLSLEDRHTQGNVVDVTFELLPEQHIMNVFTGGKEVMHYTEVDKFIVHWLYPILADVYERPIPEALKNILVDIKFIE